MMKIRIWKVILPVFIATVVVIAGGGCRSGQQNGANMKSIRLVRFGNVDKGIVDSMAKQIGEVYETPCVVAEEPLPIPKGAYDQERKQYLASAFIDELNSLDEPKDVHILGVADVDLYHPELNFVFGQAELPPGHCGVISITRLRPEFWGRKQPDPDLLLERAVKEAVHELGHTLGLQHCKNPRCVMFFSNSIADTDYKDKYLCKECKARLPKRN